MNVLGQLDNKFIIGLIRISYDSTTRTSSKLVVLIDQHAAHERILLEWLQDQYKEISQGILDGLGNDLHQFPVPLSPQERAMAKKQLVTLAYWGVVLHLPTISETCATAYVPTILYQHYASQPSRLARLVQDCIHELACVPKQHYLNMCPSSIRNILNEMACQRKPLMRLSLN
jgi:DNA mismatch repair ATPase MutL